MTLRLLLMTAVNTRPQSEKLPYLVVMMAGSGLKSAQRKGYIIVKTNCHAQGDKSYSHKAIVTTLKKFGTGLTLLFQLPQSFHSYS